MTADEQVEAFYDGPVMPSGRPPDNKRERVWVQMTPGLWYTSHQIQRLLIGDEWPPSEVAHQMHVLFAEGLVNEQQPLPGFGSPVAARGEWVWQRPQ